MTMDVSFCLEALEKALSIAKPDIFNSDQGSQFTSLDFTGRLETAGIRISMDGARTGVGQRLCRTSVAQCEI